MKDTVGHIGMDKFLSSTVFKNYSNHHIIFNHLSPSTANMLGYSNGMPSSLLAAVVLASQGKLVAADNIAARDHADTDAGILTPGVVGTLAVT